VAPAFPNLSTDGQGRDGTFNPISNNPSESFPLVLTASIGYTVTVEEVEDEDAPRKKKKKKKPKKKKKSVPSADKADVPETSSPPPSSPIIEPASPIIPSPPLVVEVPPSPPPMSQAKKKKPEKRQPSTRQPILTSSSTMAFASMSTASLEQTRAQSAHSYLQSENLTEQKVKVKTRAEPSSLPPVQEQDSRKGFFSRFSRKREAAPHMSEEETKEKRNLGAWFKNMNRKSGVFLAQILGADKSAKKGGPPMKWDYFVKVS
jgi:type IV secretory pathway VirB10-like protein